MFNSPSLRFAPSTIGSSADGPPPAASRGRLAGIVDNRYAGTSAFPGLIRGLVRIVRRIGQVAPALGAVGRQAEAEAQARHLVVQRLGTEAVAEALGGNLLRQQLIEKLDLFALNLVPDDPGDGGADLAQATRHGDTPRRQGGGRRSGVLGRRVPNAASLVGATNARIEALKAKGTIVEMERGQ